MKKLMLVLFALISIPAANAVKIDSLICIKDSRAPIQIITPSTEIYSFYGSEPTRKNPAPALSIGGRRSAYYTKSSGGDLTGHIIPYYTEKKDENIEIVFEINRSMKLVVQYTADENERKFSAVMNTFSKSKVPYICERNQVMYPKPAMSGGSL